MDHRLSNGRRVTRGLHTLSKLPLLASLLSALALGGCNESALKPGSDAGVPIAGLTGEQASRVIAKVGDRTITLADFARRLDRMEPYDRLRYQSKERRRELLNEMIDMELLAAEARRRGLDKEPETEEAVRQILRDVTLSQAREGLPAPADITPEEVHAYFDKNDDKFNEPERRRVGAIILSDKKEAEKVLKLALKAKTQEQWGELFAKHSINAPKSKDPASSELTGDLGIVGPPSDTKGGSPKVPEPLRAAVFTLASEGSVSDSLVEIEGRYFIVRLNGLTPGHHRTIAEADRSIRVLIIQEKMAAREKALEDELRKKFPIEVDERALAGVRLPGSLESSSPGGGAGRAGDAGP